MKKLYHIYNSPILNSWFNQGVNLLKSIIVIPVVITQFTVEEANVWFLFFTFIAMGQAVLFGFNSTLVRFISYSYSGVSINDFNTIKEKTHEKFNEKLNPNEFASILFLMKRIYLFISLVFLTLLLIIGFFGLEKPLSELQFSNQGWLAWYIILINNSLIIFLGHNKVFLEGIRQVAAVERLIGFTNLIGFIGILLVISFYPTFMSLILINQVIALAIAISITLLARKIKNDQKIDTNLNQKFNRQLFNIVWDSARKTGLTTVIANTVKHISAILVAQWFTASQSASFQLTKRLFDILENFTMSSFKARIPKIASLRGRGNLVELIPLLRQTQWISFFVFLAGYSVILFGGEWILKLLGSNVQLGSVLLVVSFSLATFTARWSGMALSISNQSNYVVEHINAIIVGLIFFIVIYLGYEIVGIEIFPIGLLIAILASIPVLARQVYPTINSTFFKYEVKVMFPAFTILSSINIIYWFLIK